MSEQSIRWRRAVPVAALALLTATGLVSAATAAADPLGASGAAKGAPAAAPATNQDDGCTLSPSLTVKSDTASCLGVGAALSSTPALGGTAKLTVTVKAGRAEKGTKVLVDLPSTLAFADGTATAAAVNGAGRAARATIATVDLAKGETRTFTRTVKAVGTGFGEIAAKAVAVVDKTRSDSGADYVHLTVGKNAASSHKGAPARTGDGATVRTTAKVVDGVPAGRASIALPSVSVPAQRSKADAPGTSCVTGTWAFTTNTGATVGTYQAVVQVWRSGSIVASGYANGAGGYNLCWANGGSANSVYVRFVHTNNAWKVVTLANNDYAYVTGTVSVADNSTYNFGTLLPADSTQHRALRAYYDAAVMYDWIYQSATFGSGCWSPFASSCQQLVIHWQSDSTTGTYWNSSGAYLLAASPDSEDEPVHEYGHALMYGLYGNTFPSTTNCSPHYLFTISSTTCGWTEGFADWVPTSVWGNTVYTFPSGGTSEFNVTWGAGGDNGDQVEGRIVQALDSLNDGVKYPFDNDAGDGGNYRYANKNFAIMANYRPSTFAGYWSGRAGLGYDTSQNALSALFQGTIDYGFRNPLTDGVSKNMPQAIVAHNYSATTTRGYWSVVAVRPQDGSDSDLTLYNDYAQSSVLASSAYGGSTTDFVAINSNSGARALQTYYPRVTRFTGSGNYSVEFLQGSTTFSAGATTVSTSSVNPVNIMDSYQTSGVPVYYRAVPLNGQSVALTFMQPGQTVLGRSSGVGSATGAAGATVDLVATPSATGYGGLVLTNQGMNTGSVNLYADTTAPTGGSVVINNGAAITNSLDVTLTIGAPTDAETGVANMQISTDGTFDTEAVVPFATSATTTLQGQNGTKPVYVRFQNNAGMWSAPVLDRIKQQVKPAVDSLSKTSGPQAGGTVLSIVGRRFTGATAVQFGSTVVTNFTVVNDTKVNVTIPAGTGAVHVRVRNAYGLSDATSADTYTYVAAPAITALSKNTGTSAGGNVIFITGTGFTGTTAVKFGTTPAAAFTVLSATRIQVTTPAVPASTVHVRVTSVGGTTPATSADLFTFR